MIPMMGSIYQFGHKEIATILDGPVQIQEKIDGSFIRFGVINDELEMRSKGQQLHPGAPSSKMFEAGMAEIEARREILLPNALYSGEYLMKPKHNSLAYDRHPTGHIVLFDVEIGLGDHFDQGQLAAEAERIGLDAIPVLYNGIVTDKEFLKSFFGTTSYLGGQEIEGIVIKNYSQFIHGHFMASKIVSEKFKEIHTKSWKESNPNKGDIIQEIVNSYKTEARWRKAIIHLKERGELTGTPADIGPLLKEVSQDVLKEEEDAIKEALFKFAWPKISRGIGQGLPDWFKNDILFEGNLDV